MYSLWCAGDPSCIGCGVQDVGEELDPALRPIVMQETTRRGGQLVIKLGDTEIEFNTNFRSGSFLFPSEFSSVHVLGVSGCVFVFNCSSSGCSPFYSLNCLLSVSCVSLNRSAFLSHLCSLHRVGRTCVKMYQTCASSCAGL